MPASQPRTTHDFTSTTNLAVLRRAQLHHRCLNPVECDDCMQALARYLAGLYSYDLCRAMERPRALWQRDLGADICPWYRAEELRLIVMAECAAGHGLEVVRSSSERKGGRGESPEHELAQARPGCAALAIGYVSLDRGEKYVGTCEVCGVVYCAGQVRCLSCDQPLLADVPFPPPPANPIRFIPRRHTDPKPAPAPIPLRPAAEHPGLLKRLGALLHLSTPESRVEAHQLLAKQYVKDYPVELEDEL